MSTFCQHCGSIDLCADCHENFYDTMTVLEKDVVSPKHDVLTAVKSSAVLTPFVKGTNMTTVAPTKPAAVVLQAKFIHSQDKTVHAADYGRYYSRNGWTAAYAEVDKTRVILGFTFCGANDQFNRKTGRMIAQGRLEKRPTIIQKEEGESAYDVVKEYMQEMYFEDDEEAVYGDELEKALTV